MNHLTLTETEPSVWSLVMATGTLPVDPVVHDLGHEPNGPFWDGIVQWLVETEHPDLEGRFDVDSEAGTFCAYGSDPEVLAQLQAALAPVVVDGARVRRLVAAATAAGFEFDD